MANLLSVNGIHDDDGIGADLGERVRTENFPAATGEEFAMLVRIDVDNGPQGVAEVEGAHERDTLRSRAPDGDLPSRATPPLCGLRKLREPAVDFLREFPDQRGRGR